MAARSIPHWFRKRTPALDWQVCQSDTEWEAVSQAQAPSAPRPLSPLRRFLPLGLGLVLLLAAAGLRWHSVQRERAAVEAAIDHTVKREAVQDSDPQVAATSSAAPMTGMQPQVQLEAQALTALAETPPDGGAVTRLLRVEGNVAVVEVVLPATAAQPALRQTRVYRYTGERYTGVSWLPIAPSAAHWGAFDKWTGEHLSFLYYAHDAQAVAEVAAQLDARYAELHRLFLGEPPSNKLTVVVDPAQAPGQIAHRASVAEPLMVASPAVYLAPESISDAELLAQSVVLALLDELAGQALLPYADEANAQDYLVKRTRVGQLLEGVALWQVWQSDLPLAAWRKPMVQWVFSDARPSAPAPGEVVPSFRAALCAMHRLWLPTTLALDLPLTCNDTWDSGRNLSWRRSTAPPLRLAQFPLATLESIAMASVFSASGGPHPTETVALATVMEYAADTYGPERIPILIGEASRQEGWATLIPAVFGVSIEEFEAGWQTYLAEQYGVELIASRF
jgi:hypothetical protein